MIGNWVQYFHTLASTNRSTSVFQVIQAISPVAYSGKANHEGTLKVDGLCKLPFLCCSNNISIHDMLSIQPKAHNPKWNSSVKLYLASYWSTRLVLIPSLGLNLALLQWQHQKNHIWCKNHVTNWAKLKLAGYTFVSKQQKLHITNGQNAKVLPVTTRQISVQQSLQIATQTGYSNWLTRETVKHILHMWVLANP